MDVNKNNLIQNSGDYNVILQDIMNSNIIINQIIDKVEEKISSYLTTLPTVDMNDIFGRDKDLNDLLQILSSNEKPILLNGIGGIGKTTLLKAFLTKFYGEFNHIAWIDNISDIKSSFINNTQLIDSLSLYNKIEKIEKDEHFLDKAFLLIINKMRQLKGKNLLIIDNASDDIENTKTLDLLKLKPYWNVIVSSREKFEDFYQFELKCLAEKYSKDFFYKNYDLEKNDKILTEILNLVENHTLAIELISKTSNSRRLRLNEVIEVLKKKGLNISNSNSIKTKHNFNQKIENIFEYLLKMFDISEFSNFEKWILIQFAVLPTIPIHYENDNDIDLCYLLSKNERDEKDPFIDGLNNLANKGWIQTLKYPFSFKMHILIQEMLIEKLKPDNKICDVLITNLNNKTYIQLGVNFVKAYKI
ncbi:MAG: hypothetical protein JXR68_08720, partial [Bacteroidales bacterium]|nr:hypothetical protein [Bacteroidales bacterium]